MPKLDSSSNSQENTKLMSMEKMQRVKKGSSPSDDAPVKSSSPPLQENNPPAVKNGTKSTPSSFPMNKLKNATTKQQMKVLQRLLKVSVSELKSFEKEQGVSILHKWLQEYHKTKDHTMMNLLLRVLERIPISIDTLKRTQIGKYFTTLERESTLPVGVQNLVSKLINKWRDDVRAAQIKMSAPIPKKVKKERENAVTPATSTAAGAESTTVPAQVPDAQSRKRTRDQMEQSNGTTAAAPPQKKPKKKRVTWAPPDKLEHIKIYEVIRESPQQMLLAAQKQQQASDAPCVCSELEWHKPSPLINDFDTDPQPSSEKLHFIHSGVVAPSPTEAPDEHYDDSKTPEFPWELKEDEEISHTLSSNPNLIDDILNTVGGETTVGGSLFQHTMQKPQEFSYTQVPQAAWNNSPAPVQNSGYMHPGAPTPPVWGAPAPYGAPPQWQPAYGQTPPTTWNPANNYHVQSRPPFPAHQPYQAHPTVPPTSYYNPYQQQQWNSGGYR